MGPVSDAARDARRYVVDMATAAAAARSPGPEQNAPGRRLGAIGD